jgi:hypothetical protein
MQPVASDVDELSGRRSRRQVFSSGKPLVRGTRERRNDDQATQADKNAQRPTPHVDISSVESAPFRTAPAARD